MAERQFATDQYLRNDTICAISTQIGGALTIVRVSGKDTISILKKMISADGFVKVKPRLVTRFLVCHPITNAPLDDGLVTFFKAPESYTGEDVVEFSLHGGTIVATAFLEALYSAGVRQALPGEFSFRAVRNGKINISQAQAVSEIITAKSQRGLEVALEKLSGFETKWVQSISEQLRKLAVFGELGIDFSDQDIDEVSLKKLRLDAQEIVDKLKTLESTYARGRRIQTGIKATVIGLPNSGKSSFFNSLLGEDRSIVSDIAGTTRDVIREELLLNTESGKFTLIFEDTAGIRKSQDTIEEKGIQKTLGSVTQADLIIFVLDCTDNPLDPKFIKLSEIIKQALDTGKKIMGVLSKCDLFGDRKIWPTSPALQGFGITNWVETSHINGVGMDYAGECIGEISASLIERKPGELILTRLENLQSVQRTIIDLNRAIETTESDLFAADIRQALYHLGPIIGVTLSDDILGSIFSGFCIGK